MKWGGAVVSVLLLVVWVGSGWRDCTWTLREDGERATYATLGHGRFAFETIDICRFMGASIGPGPGLWGTCTGLLRGEPSGSKWFFRWRSDSVAAYFGAPLWILVAASAAGTGLAWRVDTLARRRARVGNCPKCNYDRTGLAPGGVCPECGQASVTP